MGPDSTQPEASLSERLADCGRLLEVAEREAQANADEAAAFRLKAEDYDRLRAALARAGEEREALLASTSWRLTAPLRALAGLFRPLQVHTRGTERPAPATDNAETPITASATVKGDPITPILFTEPWPSDLPRTTLLLERLCTDTSRKGVTSAVLLSVALVKQQRAPLRIIGRLTCPKPCALDQIITQHGLSYDDNPCFDWLTITGRGAVLGMTERELIVVGSLVDAHLALTLVSADRVVYVIDKEEVPILSGASGDSRARDVLGAEKWAPVFTEVEGLDAARRAGLFAHHNGSESALVLPPTPSAADWQQIAARLLAAKPMG